MIYPVNIRGNASTATARSQDKCSAQITGRTQKEHALIYVTIPEMQNRLAQSVTPVELLTENNRPQKIFPHSNMFRQGLTINDMVQITTKDICFLRGAEKGRGKYAKPLKDFYGRLPRHPTFSQAFDLWLEIEQENRLKPL